MPRQGVRHRGTGGASIAALAVLLVLTATQLHVARAQAAAPANATADAAAPDLAVRARRVPRGGRMRIHGVKGIAGAANSSLDLERCAVTQLVHGLPVCLFGCLAGLVCKLRAIVYHIGFLAT